MQACVSAILSLCLSVSVWICWCEGDVLPALTLFAPTPSSKHRAAALHMKNPFHFRKTGADRPVHKRNLAETEFKPIRIRFITDLLGDARYARGTGAWVVRPWCF